MYKGAMNYVWGTACSAGTNWYDYIFLNQFFISKDTIMRILFTNK